MTMLEDMARAIDAELGKQEMVMTDPASLRMMMATRAARAALMAIREPDMDVGLIGAEEVNKQMRGSVKADYCAAQNSFTAMIQAMLEGKA